MGKQRGHGERLEPFGVPPPNPTAVVGGCGGYPGNWGRQAPLTRDAGKELANANEQVLGDLPPDGQRGGQVAVLADELQHRLVAAHVLQPLSLQDACGMRAAGG